MICKMNSQTNEASGRVVLSPSLAQNRYSITHTSLIWTLKYKNQVPKLDTWVYALVWIESSLYLERRLGYLPESPKRYMLGLDRLITLGLRVHCLVGR